MDAKNALTFLTDWDISTPMRKAHSHAPCKMMRRSSRVFLNDLNPGKVSLLIAFLQLCHDATQYFVDLFWQRHDCSADLADLPTVHRGRDRFGLTTRLAQALAKQAKECVRSAHTTKRRKPLLRRHTVTLYSHFVTIEPFAGPGFDWALRLIGSGAPRLTLPCHSTAHLNRLLKQGWQMSKSCRLGRRQERLFVDFLLEKPRPALRTEGRIVGMDANYKAGLVFSDGQQVGQKMYDRIQQFSRRQKHTHAEIDSLTGQALKQVDWTEIKTLAIEDLKHVKSHTRGTFPRALNRKLSHWLYRASTARLERICEELGIRLLKKNPAYTSQFCRRCGQWDKRNRQGDQFLCVHCGEAGQADLHAAQTLEFLAVAGVYGLRSPKALDAVQHSKV